VPLFHGTDKRRFFIEIVDAKHSPHVTHVRYAVRYK